MSCNSVNCSTCGTGYTGLCCPTCQPSNVITRGECQDPGVQTYGSFLSTLDYRFCRGRLANVAGLLVAQQNGSGNFQIAFSSTPKVQLTDVAAALNTAFGQMIVMGSDYRWRVLDTSAVPNLFMQTNGSGDLILGPGPAAVVPDPLAINNLSVAVAATIQNLTTNGTVTLNNISSGTPTGILGLNASNQVVVQNVASSIAASMFYEEATSPAANAPNKNAANNSYLVIGNRLYDSGANLISVTNGQTLTVNVAGKYKIFYEGLLRIASSSKGMISLEINGVIVNNGNGRNDGEVQATGPAGAFSPMCGMEIRNLAAGDVIKLQVSYSGTVNTFNVRLTAEKFADV
jgi:hypothetical protein